MHSLSMLHGPFVLYGVNLEDVEEYIAESNCIFHTSEMHEFSHSHGHDLKGSWRANLVRSNSVAGRSPVLRVHSGCTNCGLMHRTKIAET